MGKVVNRSGEEKDELELTDEDKTSGNWVIQGEYWPLGGTVKRVLSKSEIKRREYLDRVKKKENENESG